MGRAPAGEREYGAALIEEQRAVVGHSEGPLLVIAGPGEATIAFFMLTFHHIGGSTYGR